MADITVQGLRFVVAVAASGSFTAAAAALGYTQGAVSRQIAAVEAAARVPLFERGTRGVRPTAAGRLVASRGEAVIALVDELPRELAALDDRLAGRLVLGAFPTATASLVPDALALLHAEHPALEVALEEGATPQLLAGVRAGRVSVAVLGTGQALPDYDLTGLHQRLLAGDDLRIAVPDGHRLTRLTTVTPEDLTSEGWVVGRGDAGDPQFEAWPTLTDPLVLHRLTGWPSRLGMVAAGLGIAVIPGLAAPSVPAGVTVLLVEDPQWIGRATIAVARRDRPRSADALINMLRRAARREKRRDASA